MRSKLTQEYLKECLHYDPETGIFTWLTRPLSHFIDLRCWKIWNTIYSNLEAGHTENKGGYRLIGVSRKQYLAHRLAFLYIEGYFPENDIDHIDRNTSNNKWSNLREVSPRCNSQNCGISKNNISGVTGVSWSKALCKWWAYIVIDSKQINLGFFSNFDEAAMARYNEEVNNPEWKCSVESPAYLYLKEKSLIDKSPEVKKPNKKMNNTSGIEGVAWNKRKTKWVSYLSCKGKANHLGYFKLFKDAVMARYIAELDNPDYKFSESSSAYRYLIDQNLI